MKYLIRRFGKGINCGDDHNFEGVTEIKLMELRKLLDREIDVNI